MVEFRSDLHKTNIQEARTQEKSCPMVGFRSDLHGSTSSNTNLQEAKPHAKSVRHQAKEDAKQFTGKKRSSRRRRKRNKEQKKEEQQTMRRGMQLQEIRRRETNAARRWRWKSDTTRRGKDEERKMVVSELEIKNARRE